MEASFSEIDAIITDGYNCIMSKQIDDIIEYLNNQGITDVEICDVDGNPINIDRSVTLQKRISDAAEQSIQYVISFRDAIEQGFNDGYVERVVIYDDYFKHCKDKFNELNAFSTITHTQFDSYVNYKDDFENYVDRFPSKITNMGYLFGFRDKTNTSNINLYAQYLKSVIINIESGKWTPVEGKSNRWTTEDGKEVSLIENHDRLDEAEEATTKFKFLYETFMSPAHRNWGRLYVITPGYWRDRSRLRALQDLKQEINVADDIDRMFESDQEKIDKWYEKLKKKIETCDDHDKKTYCEVDPSIETNGVPCNVLVLDCNFCLEAGVIRECTTHRVRKHEGECKLHACRADDPNNKKYSGACDDTGDYECKKCKKTIILCSVHDKTDTTHDCTPQANEDIEDDKFNGDKDINGVDDGTPNVDPGENNENNGGETPPENNNGTNSEDPPDIIAPPSDEPPPTGGDNNGGNGGETPPENNNGNNSEDNN